MVNDYSVRDWQMMTPQWSIGKSFDTHGPLGPAIVTADELGDPHALDIATYVNGEVFKVAVEAIKSHKTVAQIAQMFDVHPTQVGSWKKQALAGLPDVFGNGREQIRQQADTEKDELYRQIGQLKVELDFLKKRAGLLD